MGEALKKLNFFIEEDIRKALDKFVPAGQKSRIINEALRKELLRIKRERVTERLIKLKSEGAKVSTSEIVDILKKKRRKNEKAA